jgi:phage anti-repressor protein
MSEIDEKLLIIIDNEFKTEDEKIFVKHFKIYLKYGDNCQDFVMNFDDIWEFIDFKQKKNAKNLLVKYFKIDEDYRIIYDQVDNCLHGGHNKENIILKINTFKDFCMRASTEKAKRIRNYYLKLEMTYFQYLKNKSLEIIDTMEKKMIEQEEKMIDKQLLDRHQNLLELNDMKRVVYAIKVQTFEDKSYVIKIGETINIKDRMHKIKSTFKGNVFILDVFPCENHIEFESYIHKRIPLLQTLKYKKPINDHYTSIETYLMRDDNTYKRVKNAILKSILPFKSKSIEEKKIDLEIAKAANEAAKIAAKSANETAKMAYFTELVKLYKDNPERMDELMNKINIKEEITEKDEEDITEEKIIDENKEEINKEEINKEEITEEDKEWIITKNDTNIASTSSQIEPRINQYSPVIQLYDGTDITKLIRTFPSITEATREIENSSYTAIKIAAKNKLLYLGYRWHFINRNSPDVNNAVPIGVTSTSQTRNTGYVVMTTIDNTKIEKVFLNQKSASEYIQQHNSAISQCIKFMKPLSGHNWHFWKDLDSNLQDSYLEDFELPKPEPPPRGFKVEKECTETGTITQYGSMSEAVKINRLSVNTIKKSITTGEAYKSYIWRSV